MRATSGQCSGWSSSTRVGARVDRHQQQPARSAATTRKAPALRLAGLDGLDDRAVHAVGDLVGELDADVLEPGGLEPGLVLALRERAGDAADVGAALGALFGRQVVLGDDVADPDPAARLQHARDLGQHRRLVDREVDHAVRDHDVDRVCGQRDLLDHALQEVRRCGHRRRPRSAARSASISSVMSSP